MNKRFLASVLAISTMFMCFLGFSACGKENFSEGLSYKLINNDTEYEVVGIGECVDVDIVIPEKYNGKKVTSIGKRSFENCTLIESVKLSNNIENIGVGAFNNCSNLKNIELSNNIKSIGAAAFSQTKSLQYNLKSGLRYIGTVENKYFYLLGVESDDILNADIDANCKFIGEDVFWCCHNITSVEMPDSVVSIGEFAFYNCANLSSIKLSNNLVNIEDYAFVLCSSLIKVVIPKSVMNIGSIVFEDCDQLTIYCEAEGGREDWAEDWNADRPVIYGYQGD